ncbi:MAG: hypothetical protein ACRD3S_07500, partial [Terracidiphilus sp.]
MQKNKSMERSGAVMLAILLSLAAATVAGCSKSRTQQSASQEPAAKNVKRYHLVGTIVSINWDQKTLNVDGQDIPGFMAAMVMPYPVLHASDLN